MPVVMVIILVGKAFSLMSRLGGTAATQVPEGIAGRLPLTTILSVLFLIALCYLLGRVVAPRSDLAEGTAVERAVLNRIPGYQLLRGIAMSIFGVEGTKSVKPALLRREAGITEIVLMVEALPISAVAAAKIFSRWGGGTAALLAATKQQTEAESG